MKISMGVVGFAVPILAGLVLALIGHPAVQLPPPPVVAGLESEYISGVGKLEDRLLILLDLDRLLSRADIEALGQL